MNTFGLSPLQLGGFNWDALLFNRQPDICFRLAV